MSLFKNSMLALAAGTFAAVNKLPYESYNYLTMGLAQTALVNNKPEDRKPISAQTVLATQHAKMTPFINLYIWLQSEFTSQTVITEIAGNPTIAAFGGAITDIDLTYDPVHGLFAPT